MSIIMSLHFFMLFVFSTAAEGLVKFQSDWTILNKNLVASRLTKMLRLDVLSDIETGLWVYLPLCYDSQESQNPL